MPCRCTLDTKAGSGRYPFEPNIVVHIKPSVIGLSKHRPILNATQRASGRHETHQARSSPLLNVLNLGPICAVQSFMQGILTLQYTKRGAFVARGKFSHLPMATCLENASRSQSRSRGNSVLCALKEYKMLLSPLTLNYQHLLPLRPRRLLYSGLYFPSSSKQDEVSHSACWPFSRHLSVAACEADKQHRQHHLSA